MKADELEIIDFNQKDEFDKGSSPEESPSDDAFWDEEERRQKEDLQRRREERDKRREKAREEQEKKYSWQKELFSWVVTFFIAIIAALILKNYVIINATVPTGSMENTIEKGDDLFGFRLAYLFSEPKRGDIIIFYFPDDESQKYVKRIIGLPGETVTVTDGQIYIDGAQEPLQEEYLKEEWVRATGPFEFQVPKDGYLVMGDNRNDSWDSRYWENTYVSRDQIIGKALYVYYPFDRFGKLK